MTTDPEVLFEWIRYVIIFAAFFTTAFPILYAFSTWYKSRLGRLLMLQAISLALAVDLTLLFTYWVPEHFLSIFFWNVIVFSLIGLSSAGLTWKMATLNYRRRKKVRNGRSSASSGGG